jgi:hypothetical protein
MQGRGSVTAAHLLLLPRREDRGHCTKAYQTTEGVQVQSSGHKRSPGDERAHRGFGFPLRGETNGGEGSPPRRHSNALMCLFSNARGLLRCHQHSRARHDLRLWKQPCHSLGNLRRARAGPSACMRGCGASRSAWTWSRQSNCRAMFSHWKTLPRERIKTRSPAARFLAGTSR